MNELTYLNIEDFSTDELISELQERSIDSYKQKLNLLKSMLGLKQWHTKEDIIREIKEL